jgi:membrane associated rhomboid family serine protease
VLTCPACRHRLRIDHGHRGLCWRCDQCDGELFSFGSLRSNHRQIADAVFSSARLPNAIPTRVCPLCRDPMAGIQAGGPPPIPLEVCDQCRAIWFDEAEYHRVFPVPSGRPHGAPPPVREPPAFHAWITYALLLGMIGVSLGNWLGGGEWIKQWAFLAADPWRSYGVTVLSAFFLHVNPLHLICNALVLWSFGEDCEEALGRKTFLLLVVSSTIAACVAHALIDPRPNIPCVGASGGIAGVLAYYCVRFPHRDVMVFVSVGILVFSQAMSAITWLVIWLVFQIAGAVWEHLAGSFVAYGAHVGGAIMGIVCYLIHRWLKPSSAVERSMPWWRR